MPAKKRARAGSGASSSASASAGAGAGGGAGAQTPKKPFELNRFVQDRTELTGLTLFVPRVIKSWTWKHMRLSRSADTPPVWREVCLVCKWTGVHHTIVTSPLCIRSSVNCSNLSNLIQQPKYCRALFLFLVHALLLGHARARACSHARCVCLLSE